MTAYAGASQGWQVPVQPAVSEPVQAPSAPGSDSDGSVTQCAHPRCPTLQQARRAPSHQIHRQLDRQWQRARHRSRRQTSAADGLRPLALTFLALLTSCAARTALTDSPLPSPSPEPQAQTDPPLRNKGRVLLSERIRHEDLTPMSVLKQTLVIADQEPHAPLVSASQLYSLHKQQWKILWETQAKEREKLQDDLQHGRPTDKTEADVSTKHQAQNTALMIRHNLQHQLLIAQLRERESHDSGLGMTVDVDSADITNGESKSSDGADGDGASPHARLRLRAAAIAASLAEKAAAAAGVAGAAPHVCVIVRTYHAHGPDKEGHPGALWQLLEGLSHSGMKSWEALIVMTDAKPFPELERIVAEAGKGRARIHTKLVGPQYAARDANGGWSQGYHHNLFNVTDTAIESCSSNTTWFTVTNGDNIYDPAFWKEVEAGPRSANVVAFDFYSRYQRYTGKQCYRFVAAPGAPRCKENLLRFFHADLASVALDWQRWISEKRGFTRTEMGDLEKSQGWHDAFAIHAIMEGGWQAHWVGPGRRCLVSHSPNPQLCAMEGGVWDDSTKDWGGPSCLTQEEAAAKAKDPSLQLIQIQLSHDPSSFLPSSAPRAQGTANAYAAPAWASKTNFSISCIRQVEEVMIEKTWNHPEFYHKCCAILDQPVDLLEETRLRLEALHKTFGKAAPGSGVGGAYDTNATDREEL